ncbi:uncharacterized protein LOC128337282 [Hemicordylus capensis]|uniref:uncharacterized protein LOC128337282 n=1 Tax=Hemicordylus capensis TaxID=884348 RepID=UPI0023035937|nr:uncharacterized protein LOC128337282 [Hemicordylus capensis]
MAFIEISGHCFRDGDIAQKERFCLISRVFLLPAQKRRWARRQARRRRLHSAPPLGRARYIYTEEEAIPSPPGQPPHQPPPHLARRASRRRRHSVGDAPLPPRPATSPPLRPATSPPPPAICCRHCCFPPNMPLEGGGNPSCNNLVVGVCGKRAREICKPGTQLSSQSQLSRDTPGHQLNRLMGLLLHQKIPHESKSMQQKASRTMSKEATKQKPISAVRFIIPCSVLCVGWSSEPLCTCVRRPQFSRG